MSPFNKWTNYSRKKYFLIFLFVVNISVAKGQSIWTNPITDPNPSSLNPFWIGSVSHPNIYAGGIGRGTGVNPVASADRYNASGWNTVTFDPDAYFDFEMKPEADCQINLISFVYTGQVSVNAPTSFAFRSSLDGFTTNIGSPNGTGTTIDLSAPAFQAIPGTVIFRLYAWNAPASSGNFSVNDFTFNGTVNCGIILPVSLFQLEAEMYDNKVSLNWQTSTETNVDFFSLERSYDGENFTEIARENATGNSSTVQHYYSLDSGPWTYPRFYYRAKAIDFNGNITLSNLVSIQKNQSSIFYSDGFIHINYHSEKSENTMASIYSSTGQLVQSFEIATNQTNSFPMSSSGMYLVKLSDENITEKIIIP